MLRGHSFSFPEAPDGVLHDLFPQLMILMLEEDDSGPSCPVDDDGGDLSGLLFASRLLLCCLFVAKMGRGQSPPAQRSPALWNLTVSIDLSCLLLFLLQLLESGGGISEFPALFTLLMYPLAPEELCSCKAFFGR